MLLFSSGTFTVDGISVFPDHADPKQFWYLPGPVGLEMQPNSTEPQFSLILYSPDVASAGIQGTGFLNVTLALTLSNMTQSKIMGQLRSLHPEIDDPLLSPVYFDEGTVQVVTLDLQGSGGTSQTATSAPGTGHAVQNILGASTPDLFGNNDALFDLVLTQEGATILKAAFDAGLTPVGGIYNMKFTGVQPALDVKITCDMKRAYQSFSVSLAADAYFASAGIDATFEKLRQDGSIHIDVISLSNDATTASQEQWALNLFKDQIMAQWFAPSLSPTTAAAADAQSVNVNAKAGAPPTPTTQTSTTTTQPHPATTSSSNSMQSNPQASHPTTTPPATTTASHPATTPTAGMSAPTTAPAAGSTPSATTPATTTPATTTPSGSTTPPPAATQPATTTPPATTSSTPPAGNSSTTTPAPANNTSAAVGNAVGAVAGTAAAASSAASPFGISLRLKYVNQDELKTVEIEYNQMSAVQRTYSPQGYFGLLLQGLDMSKHFLEVDGSDPFFTQFAVTLNPPKDFASIGLLTVHAALDYGIPSDPTSPAPKHGEFNFDPSNMTPQLWQIFEGVIQSNQYAYSVDYTFDPEAGWAGEQLKYSLPATTTEDRAITLDPFAILSFLRVNVLANRIDPTLVDRVEVLLSYTATDGWNTSETFVVHPGNAAQIWKVRTSDKTTTSYTSTSTCYLKDGTALPSQPVTSSATTLFVNDAFVATMSIVLQPAFDAATWKLAYVQVTYQDAAANYNFTTTQELLPGSNAVTVRIPVLNRTQMQFQYSTTLLGVSGQQSQGSPVTTSNTVLLISPS